MVSSAESKMQAVGRLASTLRRHWRRWAALLVALTLAGWAAYAWWTRRGPTRPVEIFRGVVYSCRDIEADDCHGLVHIVKIDLAAPGIGLYLTPLDPKAVSQGYQYRLVDAASVARREDLAVVVNGGYFSADSGLFYESGDLARGNETVIADGEISQLDPKSYMLWFEPDLTPHIESDKPADERLLRRVRWGIGSWALPLWKGEVRPEASSTDLDRRTAVGIDSRHKLLWLAVFEQASALAAARVLAEDGAVDGFMLDGGHSTTLVLGLKAARVRPGTVASGSRPVATCFGIRAQPLK
jgi:Phosphodiester glycosidase